MYNTTKSLNQPLFTQPNATVSKHLLWISTVTHVKAAYTTHATQWNIMKDWKIISELSQPSFCFAHGDLPVKCMDDFHWCYEGECGPEFWDTHFEVQSIATPKLNFMTRNFSGMRRWEPISNWRGVARGQCRERSSWGTVFRRLRQGKEVIKSGSTCVIFIMDFILALFILFYLMKQNVDE